MNLPKILVIVPALNEAGNIGATVQGILSSEKLAADVLVIDDDSDDATANEARSAGADVISLPFTLGIGGAVQTAFLYAFNAGYDIVVRMDGDNQHDPAFVPQLLAPILAEEADMVTGSRFLKPFLGYRSSFIRRAGIHFFSGLISLLTRFPVTDPTSGFSAFNRRTFGVFARHYPSDFPEPESIVVARRVGLRLMEVPVQMRKRVRGHSSIRYFRTLHYMIKVTSAIILDTIKHERVWR